MIDGLWTMEFRAGNNLLGRGVVVVNNGRILGGDSGFTYIGSAEVVDGTASVQVQVKRFENSALSLIPDLNEYTLNLNGAIGEITMTLAGHIEGHDQQLISIIGTKRAGI